jgi:Bifunctional DNA primase/polymerase, N-terminal
MTGNYDEALRHARAGMFLHPCDQTNKKPCIDCWPTRATNMANGVRYFWDTRGLDSMPGIATGKSGLVAIDLDVKGKFDGVSAFDDLLNQHGELPRCPVTRTPSGGFHLIFRQPSNREPIGNRTGALPRGIDVRGNGGYVIAPGAVTADGTFYEGVAGWPDLAEAYAANAIPEIPGWLLRIIETKVEGPAGSPCDGTVTPALGDKSNWAAAGLEAEARALAATGVGSRNAALYRFVCTFAGHAANGWTTRDEIYAAAHWACTQNGYLSSSDSSDGLRQFEKTFASGWRWGFEHPTRGPRERPITIDPAFAARIANLNAHRQSPKILGANK